ncbi:hypothetical protein SAMN04487906_1960 [Zhouia amylolytica]|uniref:tRNA modification GTPase n=2 Tax=Zhouia amylolytica TaxID=376730 RepID=W2US47_9FLAO|nr:DUF4870 domain-containing protein [Zhouia amylolytica]ETN96286.1 hypothetical protein P278_07970 [Zhouia amylolytica AD3]MCQ0112224.1 DUF4870 domain-containing protein [Zhouia amylolytica]SFS86623.1 hypothetical protein SAMN04487906_1960 [Zhouia amylolytica]
MRKDNQLIVLTHLSQLLDYVTGVGGFIVPLVLWLTQRDKIEQMDEHGKSIINFQISILVYALLSIPLIFLLGFGILVLIAVGIMAFIFPIINAIKASNGEKPYYPLSLPIF